ncbi:MAG TPA: hypothetical protein VKN36_05855 [Eudoraea sp.]|nr:hypothetical protein [Eudoraea sp.]
MYRRFTFNALVFLFGQQGYSQTCCSGGVLLSNNLGLPNEGTGVLTFGLNYDYNNLNTLNAGAGKLDDDSRKRITNSLLLGLGYAITDTLSLENLLTRGNQTRTISQFGNENFTGTTGIGDPVFLVKYTIADLPGANTVLNIGAGTKAPLGKSDIRTDQGILLTADLQPDSGAWDGHGWLSFNRESGFNPSATFSGNFTYRLTRQNHSYLNNSSTYEFGDEFHMNPGYTDQLLMLNTIINPGLILKYRKAGMDRINDFELANTGGEWVFLRFEINTQITPDPGIALRLEVPVYSYVEGTRLTTTLRFSSSLTFKLDAIKCHSDVTVTLTCIS